MVKEDEEAEEGKKAFPLPPGEAKAGEDDGDDEDDEDEEEETFRAGLITPSLIMSAKEMRAQPSSS